MNTNNSTTTNNEPLAPNDPRMLLLSALRARLAAMQAAEAAAGKKHTESTNSLLTDSEVSPQGETTEPQPLNAGTVPESCRNDAGTPPEYSGHSAEMDAAIPASHCIPPKQKGKRSSNESDLDDLPAETQAEMLHFLDTLSLDAATLEITTKPPYGMGIETSRSSLYRFHQRHTTARNTRRRQEDAAATAKLVADAKSPGDISLTATHLIALRLVETAVQENSDPSHLLALSKAIDRLHAIQHSERRLRLAEQKAQTP